MKSPQENIPSFFVRWACLLITELWECTLLFCNSNNTINHKTVIWGRVGRNYWLGCDMMVPSRLPEIFWFWIWVVVRWMYTYVKIHWIPLGFIYIIYICYSSVKKHTLTDFKKSSRLFNAQLKPKSLFKRAPISSYFISPRSYLFSPEPRLLSSKLVIPTHHLK